MSAERRLTTVISSALGLRRVKGTMVWTFIQKVHAFDEKINERTSWYHCLVILVWTGTGSRFGLSLLWSSAMTVAVLSPFEDERR